MTHSEPIEYAVNKQGTLEYQCGCKFIEGKDDYRNCWFWEHCSTHGGSEKLRLVK